MKMRNAALETRLLDLFHLMFILSKTILKSTICDPGAQKQSILICMHHLKDE